MTLAPGFEQELSEGLGALVTAVRDGMSSRTSTRPAAWPAHLRPGALPWIRASSHCDDTIAFYRDLIGLRVVGGFTSSFGEDGTIFGLSDTRTQLEVVRPHEAVEPNPFDDMVFYHDNADAVAAATSPLRTARLRPEPAPHSSWRANGAAIFRDPDGRGVFAPRAYGRDPVPSMPPIANMVREQPTIDRPTAPSGAVARYACGATTASGRDTAGSHERALPRRVEPTARRRNERRRRRARRGRTPC